MKRRTLFALGLSACVSAGIPSARAARHDDELDAFVEDGLAKTGAPGMALGIVRAGQPDVVRSYGYADLQSASRITPDTAFHIASVSKVVTGTAMMMLSESEAYKLDDPVSGFLDFPVSHPRYPGTPITFRHLFTHTSGISDALYNASDAFSAPGVPALSLRDFLRAYLSPGGRYYDPERAFSSARPGTQRAYSNVGIALLGYLAGRVGKLPLDRFCRDQLFRPLGMVHTAWSLDDLGKASVALPYEKREGMVHALPPVRYPDWPAGLLRTSAADFARFVKIFCEHGTVAGRSYLRAATLAEFFSDQSVQVDEAIRQGLVWELRSRNGIHLASHFGGDPGAASFVCLDIDKRVGVFAFANITSDHAFLEFQRDVLMRLLKQARAGA